MHPKRNRHSLPCIYRAEDTGKRVRCGPKSRCMAKVYRCRIFGLCTVGASVSLVKQCARCSSRIPPARVEAEY